MEEGAFLLDSKTDVVVEDMPKVEKLAKEPTGNSGRKRLADISNMPRKPSTLSQDNNKPRQNSATVKEYIEQLQKENAALIKILADKNRIIELSGAELHKLRITLQKMQQQNLQLAQTNSQMLAELNSGKDRLKDLQHQLGCKNGVLIARKLELEGKGKTKACQTNNDKRMKVSEQEDEMGVCIVAEQDKGKQCNTGGRQKSKSLGPSVRKDQGKGVGDNGRQQARRQSARFKHDEPKPTEDLFHTDNVELPPCPVLDTMQEDDLHLVNISVKKEDVEGESGSLQRRRLSISRPSREAAKKVQSYKEMNVNVKLRRTE